MLKLLPILTCLTIINALSITQTGWSVIIKDCELKAQEHLNLEGPKTNLEHVTLSNCNGVIDDKTFTGFTKLAYLVIRDSNIEEINTALSIKQLEVRNSHFPNLDEDLQQKLPELKILGLERNKDFQVDPHQLKNFKKLTNLFILQTNFTEDCVTNEWFKGLDLRELYLTECNISCIYEDAFDSLKNLQILYLEKNHISNFEKETFKNLTMLKALRISGNDIETIDLNIFASQKNHLEELQISWNALKQSKIAAEELLRAFPKLQVLVIPEEEPINDSKAVEFCEIVIQNGPLCYASKVFLYLSSSDLV